MIDRILGEQNSRERIIRQLTDQKRYETNSNLGEFFRHKVTKSLRFTKLKLLIFPYFVHLCILVT